MSNKINLKMTIIKKKAYVNHVGFLFDVYSSYFLSQFLSKDGLKA